MEELHYTLKRNEGRVVRLYDEISLLEQLGKYKNGSSDRKTFLSLINGSPWRRNFRNSNSIISNTCFNIAGFIQPDVIVTLLNGNDYDGFCDRQFFVCPPELDKDYDEIIQPPSDVADLKDVFRLLDKQHNNTTSNTYLLSKEAHNEFVAFHDELNARKRAQHRRDRDRKSVLSKAKGQVVRLAAVMYAIHQAITSVATEGNDDEETQPWTFEIPADFFQKAANLTNFCIEQKFYLGKPAFVPATAANVDQSNDTAIDEHRIKRVLELTSPITISKISQSHIQRRVDSKYRKEEAEELMNDVVKISLGEIVIDQAGKLRREKKTLSKRKIADLTEENKELLKRLKVDMDKFNQ